MFCEKCGKKIDDDSLFCGFCGAKMEPIETEPVEKKPIEKEPIVKESKDVVVPVKAPEQSFVEKPKPKPVPVPKANESKTFEEKPPMSKEDKKGLASIILAGCAVLAVVIAVAVFFAVGLSVYGPRAAAKKFVKAYAFGDYATAYQYLDVDESNPYTSVELFAMLNEDNAVTRGKVTVTGVTRYQGVTVVTVTCADQEYNLTAVKQEENAFLFFPEWKIDAEDFLVEDVTLTVPTGCTIILDGIPVDAAYYTKTDLGYDYYEIPAVFGEDHYVAVDYMGYVGCATKVSFRSGTSESCEWYPTDEQQAELAEIAYGLFCEVVDLYVHGEYIDCDEYFIPSIAEDEVIYMEDSHLSIVELTDVTTYYEYSFAGSYGLELYYYTTYDLKQVSVSYNYYGGCVPETYEYYSGYYMAIAYVDGKWKLASYLYPDCL